MDTTTVKETIYTICKHAGVLVTEVDVREDELGTIFSVKAENGHLLTDKDARGLAALNYIVKKIIERENETPPIFSIDINECQKQKNELLMQKARMYAERAKSFGTEVELDPMNAYERMVVHNALSSDESIETESRGFGRDRRVVIKQKR